MITSAGIASPADQTISWVASAPLPDTVRSRFSRLFDALPVPWKSVL